jgi:hypothetical protein
MTEANHLPNFSSESSLVRLPLQRLHRVTSQSPPIIFADPEHQHCIKQVDVRLVDRNGTWLSKVKRRSDPLPLPGLGLGFVVVIPGVFNVRGLDRRLTGSGIFNEFIILVMFCVVLCPLHIVHCRCLTFYCYAPHGLVLYHHASDWSVCPACLNPFQCDGCYLILLSHVDCFIYTVRSDHYHHVLL